MTGDARDFRGFDPNRDMPADPFGEVHPMAEELLRLSKEHKVMILLPTGAYSDSWARDLFEQTGTVLTESPPCAFSAGEGVLIFNGEDHPVRDLRITVDESRCSEAISEIGALRAGMWGRSPLFDIQQEIYGRGRFDHESFDLKMLPEPAPEPTGRRYGPYDADPHTKGRRRRFRRQRKT